MDLSYDWGYGTNQFNGNISGQRWQSAGDGAQRSFGYGYDNPNRLLYADFNQQFGSSWGKSDPGNANFTIDFSVTMGDGIHPATAYDQNGNILAMKQMGLVLNQKQIIDNLSYTYSLNSNKLLNVVDGVNNPTTTLGDFRSSQAYLNTLGGSKNSTAVDYTYDGNGNLIKDMNKDIDTSGASGIIYNHLNLPYQVQVQKKGIINYIYDAAGNKLEKRVTDYASNKTTYTTYIGGFVYQDNTLQFFGTEEGRVRVTQALVAGGTPTYNYDYFIKDHLGNTRMVLTDQQEQDVYPVATLESGATATESQYYTINTGDIVPMSTIPSFASASGNSYQNNNGNPPYNTNPNSNTTATSLNMYRLNGSTGDKTGLGITLQVMAGDIVNIMGKSYWHNNGTTPNNNFPITSVLSSFITSFAGTSAVAGADGGIVTGSALNASPVTPGLLNTLLSNVPTPSTTPKAYINWILFDEQFRPVTSSSGFSQIGAAEAVNNQSGTATITKNGYLYVYCSNESDRDVFYYIT